MNDGTQGASAQPGRIGTGAGPTRASNPPAAVALPGVRQYGTRPHGRVRRASAGDAESRGLSRPGLGSPAAARILIALVAALFALALGAALAGAAAPVLTIENAKDVEYTTAKVAGTVNPEDHETSYHFEYITDAQYLANEGNAEPLWQGASEVGHGSVAENAGVTPVSEQLSGLQPDTTYHLRLVATNTESETIEAVAASTFTTKAVAKPLVTGLTAGETEFSGFVNPNAPKAASELEGGSSEEEAINGAFATHWWFSCDPGCNFSGPSEGDLKADDSATEVSADPTGLTPNQTYDVTLHASNAGGETTETKVAAFQTPTVKPTVDRATLYELTRTSVVLRAAVDRQNAPLTECRFLYGAASLTEHEVPCPPVNELQQLTVDADAGQYRLIFEGDKTEDIEFDAPAAVIQAALEALPSIGPGNVLVAGSEPIDVTFRGSLGGKDVGLLEWESGTIPLSGSGVETLQVGPGGPDVGPLPVSGLTPATEYQFQVIAANAAGTTEGEVRSFTTPEEPSESCPNEAIRQVQHATHLPDCRAWEKVSPAEKGNGDIIGDGGTNVASVAGDAVTMSTRTPFGDTIGSGVVGQTQYIARRGAGGWATHAITPQPRFDESQIAFGPTRYQAFSDDLRSAVVWGYDFPTASGDVPLRNNIYVEDTETRALQTVTLAANLTTAPFWFEFSNNSQWGISADARHVTFVSWAKYLPEAAPGDLTPNVYQWDEGTLSLAGILPGGTVPAGGSDVPNNTSARLYRDAMSDDGSRQLFVASPGGPNQLYQRIDGNRTVWISEPEGSDPSAPEGVTLRAATPDGRHVFFTTDSPLLDEDDNPGWDLYRWTDGPDPENEENLKLISVPSHPPESVLGLSGDGQRLYYHSSSSGAVWLWDNGSTRLVHSTVGSVHPGYDVTEWSPGLARVSSDGRYLAFTSDGYNQLSLTGPATDGRAQVYLYDLENDALNCISCPPHLPIAARDGAVSMIKPTATSGTPSYTHPGFRPRFLAGDGRVFFNTPEPLLSQDTNGVMDPYVYDPAFGDLGLLSSGIAPGRSSFSEASVSGDDVFIVTREPLLPSDTDDFVDLYDVRSGGGFDEPVVAPPAPCSGEGCQGSADPAPGLASPASRAEGRGNVNTRRPPHCGKRRGAKQSAVRKKHCPKHNKAHGKRPANADRRAAR